jgi:hypothetical protein
MLHTLLNYFSGKLCAYMVCHELLCLIVTPFFELLLEDLVGKNWYKIVVLHNLSPTNWWAN